MARREQGPKVLFIANYPANTGYAWANIERTFSLVAKKLEKWSSVTTKVAYPEIISYPRSLVGGSAEPVELDMSFETWRVSLNALKSIWRIQPDVVYFTDRPYRSCVYLLLRLSGVSKIIVHDRTSGLRTRPTGLKKVAKYLVNRIPLITADRVIAVSEFVRDRLEEVVLIPEQKIGQIYNGFPVPPSRKEAVDIRNDLLGEGTEAPIFVCACRAAEEKGVDVLLRAFEELCTRLNTSTKPYLIYVGDGPQLDELKRLCRSLDSSERIIFGGYLSDAVRKLRQADVFVVPSVWADAFPSAVLEPMAWGRPVIGTSVGGIPEMIDDGENGLLVPAGNEAALADAMERLIKDEELRRSLGDAAVKKVRERFSQEEQVTEIARVIRNNGEQDENMSVGDTVG